MDLGGAFSTRHVAPSDSRLLSNLIKAERNYITHLRSSVNAAHGASSSLSAWGTSEAPDVADASGRLANLLSACADVQSTHVAAIEGYRAALKDVADREASIRTVFRDRDILVSRLIKASQKSASASNKKSPEERAEKVAKAQRELAACEEVLTVEEAALVGVKRRTFKEALTMRMKTMGDAGAAMVDAAKEAIILLDQFDSTAYQMPISPIEPYDESGLQHQHGINQDNLHPYHQYHQYNQGAEDQYAVNHPNFENSSVTPSQSASQVYQPNHNRDSMMYNAPFSGIAEGDANHIGQQQNNGNADEYDSDEEDWQRSFGGGVGENAQPVMVHQGGGAVLPAPHQLDMRAGTEADFVPHMFPVHSTRNNNNNNYDYHNASPDLSNNQSATPAPTPPAKDESNKRLSRNSTMKKPKRNEAEDSIRSNPSQLNYVSMPPIPTAPRLNSNGVNLAPIPTAPKLYMPGASGAQDDSSDDDDDGQRRSVAHRGGGSDWTSRNQARKEEDGNSSDEGTAKASRTAGNRKSSIFGKMGRLFRGDSKNEEARPSASIESRPKRSSSQWDTRTDANIRNNFHVHDPSSLQRRQSALSKPLVPTQEDSSDEEQVDERKLVRNVNKGPPLWQTQKSNSDIGTSKSLIKRPSALRRTPSATINAGPLSWKAHQEAEEKKRPESVIGQASAPEGLSRSSTMISTTPSKKKKKKVKSPASNDGGSEIGTQPTRTKALATAGSRNSVIVTGDASSGIRRSDSLNYGSMRGAKEKDTLAKRSSKRLSAMSTQQIHGHGNKVGAMGSIDPSGKFATSNWVAKSNVDDIEENKPSTIPVKPTARHAVTGQAPKAANPKPQVTSTNEPPKHVPQPSRTMSPPLKPALKHGTDLTRSASAMSTGAPILPSIPAPISAPPPASSLLDKQSGSNTIASNPSSLLSLEQDKNIDGTGRLNFSSLNEGDSSKDEGTVKVPRTALPRIDMPASEPFRVELTDNGGKGKVSTPQKEGVPTFSNGDPLLTPNERKAYADFMSTGENDDAKKVAGQPEGVTRTTVARASVGGGVLGPKNVPPPQQQHEQEKQQSIAEESLKPVATHLAPKLSRSYSGDIPLSDSSSEEENIIRPAKPVEKVIDHQHTGTSTATATKTPTSILSSSHLHAAQGNDGHERSPDGSGVGSTVSRRKSVRMAPDVKLPPETPPADVPKAFGTQQTSSKLSSRIAPPPPAPPRVTAHSERPIDLGAMPERTGWSTRIGMSRTDDSSDEENGGEGQDAYAAARKNFGSISKSWGKAMGKSEATDHPSSAAGGGGSKTGSITKKKKKKSAGSTNSGYNPAIPLPVGMEVVGRSASRKGK